MCIYDNFVVANKSWSEVCDDVEEAGAYENVAGTGAEELAAAAATDAPRHRDTRQKHRYKSLVRHSACKKWMKKDICDTDAAATATAAAATAAAATAADADDDDDVVINDDDVVTGDVRETVASVVGQTELTGGTDVVVTESHDQSPSGHHELLSHKTVSVSDNNMPSAACNILDIIDDMCSSRQRGDVKHINVVLDDNRCARLSSDATEQSRPHVAVEVDEMKTTSVEGDNGEVDDSTVAAVNLYQPVTVVSCQPVRDEKETASKPRSTETAQNCLRRCRIRRTRLATPGRAAHAKHTTPRRAGNLRQTTPRRAGKPRQTTPGRVGNPRQTTPQCAGKPRQTTPQRVGNPKQITPGRVGNPTETTPGYVGNPRQITPGRAGDKRRSVLLEHTRTPASTSPASMRLPGSSPAITKTPGCSPAIMRVPGSSPAITKTPGYSPALKRNAKGETALHTAAIKVVNSLLYTLYCYQ